MILDAERDSLRSTIKPYFTMDETIGAKMQMAWRNDYDKNLKGRLSPVYDHYVVDFLRNIYRQGLISNEDSKALHADDVMEINLLQADRSSNREPLTRFYTLKEAYEMFVEEASHELLTSGDLPASASRSAAFLHAGQAAQEFVGNVFAQTNFAEFVARDFQAFGLNDIEAV